MNAVVNSGMGEETLVGGGAGGGIGAERSKRSFDAEKDACGAWTDG